MARISPTAEGFRTAFRQPSLTLGEIAWRWAVGATTAALFLCGLFEYLDTLPVNRGELLFLRSRQPYLVAKAIAHILRGSLSRVVLSATLAAMLLALLWMIAGALGRIATVGALIDHFRDFVAGRSPVTPNNVEQDHASVRPAALGSSAFPALFRLNFLRACLAIAAVLGFVGAAILAGFASPDSNPQPGIAFLLFMPLAGLIGLIWWALNWLLSLAAMFAVRDGEDVIGAISAAVALCRKRTGALAAVSTWTGLAHLVAFVGATTVISVPLGFAPIVPWRLVVAAMILVALAYFMLADWLYMARLAGYVCIAEVPEEPLVLAPPAPVPTPPALITTIDRDEPILSDTSNPLSPHPATG